MTTRRLLRLSVSITTMLVLAGVSVAGPTSAASPTACRVRNLDTGVTKTGLQKAVRAATAGDRLTVRGTCRGRTRINRQRLTITGIRRPGSGQPTLVGNQWGSTLSVPGGKKVWLTKLTIRGGTADNGGGGIVNIGNVVLRDVVIRDNDANYGGGVLNLGHLRLLGSTSIRHNTAGTGGGVETRGPVILEGTSSISGNTTSSEGGGVHIDGAGSLTMGGSTSISGNIGDNYGGGVWIRHGTLTMTGESSITGNTATDFNPRGGGLYADDATLVGVVCQPEKDANVYGNVPEDCYIWPA